MQHKVGVFMNLQEALDTWREWGLSVEARPAVIGPVPGGRTNRSFQIRAPGVKYDLLLRLNNLLGPKLGINRDWEAEILQSAAGAGLTRGACYWDPQQRFTLFRHVEARTWTDRDFSEPAQLRRLEESLGLVHSLEPKLPRRRYYDYLNHYWQQLERGGGITSDLRRRWQAFAPEVQAFDQAGWPACLTHYDLIPENILENHQQIYLIDWEYAAVGHPDIDVWCLDPSQVREPFIHDLASWTNDLWERLVILLNR